MKLLTNLCLAAIVCLCVSCHFRKEVNQTTAYRNKDQIWKDFRSMFNYHLQIIGASAIHEDGSLNVLISEPPPHVDEIELKKLLIDYKFLIEEKENKIAYDGWTKDLMITISGIDAADKEPLIKLLNNYVYNSDYKAFAVDLPVKTKSDKFLNNLNYKIQVSELNKWFIDGNEQFYNDQDSTVFHNLQEFLSQGGEGVLYSRLPGFVVWLLRESSDISNQNQHIRKFTLDADLILGAIKNSHGSLAIIGRERVNSVLELPPLRTETIQLLAAANDQEISQSYERTNLFAGKMNSGKDWAPIYLSKDLINTEYGSLLNITDQMLKSWSMSGKVEYEGFGYTKPSYFAFDGGVMDEMKTVQVTFNWNTKGAGYTVEKDGIEFYALNRSGALPVTYIPEGMQSADKKLVSRCEQKAYAYFANLNNADLARVVQYASLYQIFSRYNITSYKDAGYKATLANPLQTHAIDLIRTIENMDDDQKYDVIIKVLRHSLSRDGATEAEINRYIKSIPEAKFQTYYGKFDKMQELIKAYTNISYANSTAKFANAIVNPREQQISTDDDEYSLLIANKFRKDVSHLWQYMMEGTTADSMKNEYVKAFEAYNAKWIKTPSIVVSWFSTDSAIFVGGHNLGAKVTPFKVSSEVSPGRVKIIDEGGVKTVLVNELDIGSINGNLLRQVAVDNSTEASLLVNNANYVPRNINEVFPATNRVGRGLNANHVNIEGLQTGFRIGNKTVNTCDELVNELTLLADKNKIDNLQVHFENVDGRQAKALVRSSELKMNSNSLYEAKLLSKGSRMNITSDLYDFNRMKVTSGISNDIVIEVPKLAVKTSQARITIRNVAASIRDRIIALINTVTGRSQRNGTDLYKELIFELQRYHIKESDIRLEVDDCIICLKTSSSNEPDC